MSKDMFKDNKRRLLKDLPFVKKRSVIFRVNGGYIVSGGRTFYEEGGSSDRGNTVFDELEENVIDLAWDNPEWFETAEINHVDIRVSNDKIILEFKPLDSDDAEALAMGIQHILPHLKEGSYTWNKFNELTTRIKN